MSINDMMARDRVRENYRDIEAQNARLREALSLVRKIITDGAMVGFNPLDGDWADRLFASQATTYAALNS